MAYGFDSAEDLLHAAQGRVSFGGAYPVPAVLTQESTRPETPFLPPEPRGRERRPGRAPKTGFDSYFYYPQNLADALDLVREAAAEKSAALARTAALLENALGEDREILTGIQSDEYRHLQLLRQIYFDHVGTPLQAPPETPAPPADAGSRFEEAFLAAQAAAAKACRILFAMQAQIHKDALTEICTDELRHAVLFFALGEKYARRT